MLGITRQLVLAVSLSGVGSHPAAPLWGDPSATASWRHWASLIAEADRGGLELVTLADGPAPPAETGTPLALLDPTLIACRVAPVSDAVGLVPEIPTVTTEPFLVSTQIATLDHVSGGRAGWSVIVSERESDGDYVGPRPVPPLGDRFGEAAEHIEAVRRLWDSWEDDAEIRDASTNRFIDRERLHHIDYEGLWLSVKGPSITPRPPQGQPIIAVTIRGEQSLELAAEHADVAFAAAGLEMLDTTRRLGDAVAASGREPDQVRVLADLEVVLSDDPGAARERAAQLDALAPRDHIADATLAAHGASTTFVGTPAALADQLIEQAGDDVHGFRLHPAVIGDDLPLIAHRLTDELRTRGARDPRGVLRPSLRARLGLINRPANRFAVSPR